MRNALTAIFCAVALAIATGASSASSYDQEWIGIETRVGDSIHRLESMIGGDISIGSTALINTNKYYVLTAAHCVPEGIGRLSITVNKLHAEVVKINDVIDLAVLRVPGLSGRQIYLRKEPVEIGLPIAVAGFAFAAARPKYTFGYVSDPADPSLWDGMFVNAEVIGGHSGGVVVDTAGRLVGTTQAIFYRGISKLGLAADAKAISAFAGEYWGKPESTPVKK